MSEQNSIKLTVNSDVETFIKESSLKTIIKNYATKIYNEKGIRIPNLEVEKDEKLQNGQAVLYVNGKPYKKGKQMKIKPLIKQIESKLYEFVTPEYIDSKLQALASKHTYIYREINRNDIDLLYIHRVFQNLARERVTIQPFKKILDSLFYHYPKFEDIDELIFNIRNDIIEYIVGPYIKKDGYADALSLRKIEEKIGTYCFQGEYRLSIATEQEREIIEQVKESLIALKKEGINPILIVNFFGARAAFGKLLASHGIKAPVLTSHEATITNTDYKGVQYLGEFEQEEYDPEEYEDKLKLREKMLDLALDVQDEELFKKLTSDDWENYL